MPGVLILQLAGGFLRLHHSSKKAGKVMRAFPRRRTGSADQSCPPTCEASMQP